MTVPVNPLLVSRRAPNVEMEPFPHFEIDNFLPSDVYAEALATFPQRAAFPEETEGNKLRLTSSRSPDAFAKFVDAHPAWRKVIEWMKDEVFLTDLYEVTQLGLAGSRGRWAARPWSFEQPRTAMEFVRRVQVRAEFEFSRLEPGAYVPPHTDGPTKLVSALLYFPDTHWQSAFGGDTVYYRGKQGRQVHNWRNMRLSPEELEPFRANRFTKNRLAVFLKSAHSHHAVDMIQCPTGMARNSLNFNVYATLSPIELRLTRAKMQALAKLAELRGQTTKSRQYAHEP